MSELITPDHFLWGAATAAYQIEGATTVDGRGECIWDTYCRIPGKTANGEDGSVAADHYHLWKQDVALMRQMNLDAYRFSVAWPRIQANGVGPANQKGLDFYKKLSAELLANDIEPYVTLYHWDLPQALQDQGGWESRVTAEAFADYAALVAEALQGEGVTNYFTVNEPWCSAFLGYASGVHAPGITDPAAALKAAHNLSVAHVMGTRAIKAVQPEARVGAALNMRAVYPADPSNPADVAAARKIEVIGDEIFIAPMYEGRYPEELFEMTEGIVDWNELIVDGDLPTADELPDLIGVNYYYALRVEARTPDSPASGTGGHGDSGHTPWIGCDDVVIRVPEPPLTAMGWSIDPEGLAKILDGLHQRFTGLPIAITENGLARDDEVTPEGTVHDPERIDYLHQHIDVIADARRSGAPVQAYFVWSLMDNFEWARGYSKRFGLVHINYETLERTVKDSGLWYGELASRGLAPEELTEGK